MVERRLFAPWFLAVLVLILCPTLTRTVTVKNCSLTAVGFCIKKSADAAMLSLCQSPGGDLSRVSFLESTCQEVDSAMEYSIFVANPACLAFILDVMHPVRPAVLIWKITLYLVAVARKGVEGIDTFRVLNDRGLALSI